MRGISFTVWVTVSSFVFSVLVLLWIAPEKTIAQFIPTCPHSVSNGEQGCPACGLTRAFYAIKRGDFIAASEFNRGSIPLFVLFCCNTLFFSGMVTVKQKNYNQ